MADEVRGVTQTRAVQRVTEGRHSDADRRCVDKYGLTMDGPWDLDEPWGYSIFPVRNEQAGLLELREFAL